MGFKHKIKQALGSFEIHDWHAWGFLLAVVVIFFAPFLFFGKIFNNGDATYYAYPIAYFFKYHFGEAINYLNFSGYPMDASFQIGLFHPLYQVLFSLFDFLLAYHFILFINFTAAALFTYSFVRALGASCYASALSAIAFVFGQFAIAWVSMASIAGAIFLLPALFYLSLRISQGRNLYMPIMGAIVGLSFLGTHYQFVVSALLASCCFFAFRVFKEGNFKAILYFCLALLIAVAIALPQATRSLALFVVSNRATTFLYRSVSPGDLVRYLVPTFELPFLSSVEFRPYIGIVPLFFGLVAMYAYVRRFLRGQVSFFFWLFAACLVLSLKYSPLLFVVKVLPVVNYFVELSRWMYIGNFALVVLAAFGFDYVREHSEQILSLNLGRIVQRLLYAVVCFLVFANTMLVLFGSALLKQVYSYFDLHLYAQTTQLPLAHYHSVIKSLADKIFENVSFANPNVVIFLACLLGLIGLISILHKKSLFSKLAIALATLNLLLVANLSTEVTDANILTTPSQIAQFIKSRQAGDNNYRIYGFLIPFAQYQMITALHPEDDEASFEFGHEALIGNLNIFSDAPILSFYDPLAFRRYQNLMAFLDNSLDRKTVEDKSAIFKERLPVLSMMGVRYIISPYKLSAPTLKLVFSETVTRFHVPLYVYENALVMPRFYVPQSVSFIGGGGDAENESFRAVTRAGDSLLKHAFIECGVCQREARWLVFATEAVPGWRATVDGNPVKIYYANHAYQAILVPPGEHDIEFSYRGGSPERLHLQSGGVAF